jgi:Peptidase M50B-like
MNFTDFVAWLGEGSSRLPAIPTLLLLIVGAGLAASPRIWRATRLLATWVHEGAHALVALLFGRVVTGIRLEADTSGTTHHVGPKYGLGRFLSAFAGYPGPSLAGYFMALGMLTGHFRWVLFGMLISGVLLTLFQRSSRGWVVSLSWLAACGLFLVVPEMFSIVFTVVIAGYLMMASPRTIIELHRGRRRAHDQMLTMHSDADELTAQTGIPALLWELCFAALSLALTWQLVAMLFPHTLPTIW